ncbi:MAG: branched-chain amino acid ABC transporter permease [Acidimicrobiales bacterium]
MGSGVFAETYVEDLRLRRGPVAHLGTVGVAMAAVAFPFLVSQRLQVVGVFALIAAIGAIGLQILTGFAGQVSLGHAAFLGVGAYAATWLGVDQELPLWVWLPGAGVAAALVGAIVGPLASRFRGLYLAVVTVALVFIAIYVWRIWTPVTGGPNGRSAVSVSILGTDLFQGSTVAGVELSGDQAYWFFALVVLTVLAVAARNLQRTRVGRSFASVRERDLAAAVAGIPVTRTKVVAFVVSSFYAGIAGALLAAYQSYVLPEQWGLGLSIQYIAMIVIGGIGTIFGAVVGAAFVAFIPEIVRSLTGVLPFISEQTNLGGGLSVGLVSNFLYGAIIVVVLVFEPRGLQGLWERFKAVWTTWPWSY